jgi:hypothetical protein
LIVGAAKREADPSTEHVLARRKKNEARRAADFIGVDRRGQQGGKWESETPDRTTVVRERIARRWFPPR